MSRDPRHIEADKLATREHLKPTARAELHIAVALERIADALAGIEMNTRPRVEIIEGPINFGPLGERT